MSRFHKGLDRRRLARFRRIVLERDGWRCRACGRAGKMEADHVIPIHKGGDPYDEENGQSLCRGCHIAKTRKENTKPSAARDRWADLIAARLRNP